LRRPPAQSRSWRLRSNRIHPVAGKLDCRDIIGVGRFGDKTFAASGSGKAVVVI
jgi:hypothetical protein